MLVVAAGVLVLLAVPLLGGDLRRVADLRLRSAWLVLVALVAQVVVISIVTGGPEALWRAVHLLTYGALGIFFVRNRTVPRLWIVGVGGLSNLIAIVANGGVMPAAARALDHVGIATSSGFDNSRVVHGAHLAALGDVFSTPSWLPLSNVFSVGDVLIVVGLGCLAVAVSRIPGDVETPFIRPRVVPAASTATDADVVGVTPTR